VQTDAALVVQGPGSQIRVRTEVAAAKAGADALWTRYTDHQTAINLRACFSAEAALRRSYDEAAGACLRMARAVPFRRAGGSPRHPAIA